MTPVPAPSVHIDIGELLRNRVRTGIQRVECELIRHWPESSRLVPVIAGEDGFRLLPTEILHRLVAGEPVGVPEPARLPRLAVDPRDLRLLNPELFHDAVRGRCYARLFDAGATAIGWLIYDFIPWLHPQHFPPRTGRHTVAYLQALRRVPHVAHISEQTRIDYETRIMRGQGQRGPVFALGADGLAMPRQQFSPARRAYVSLGTLEPRKNVAAVLEAFAQLWAEGCTAELVVLGTMHALARAEAMWLERLAGEPRLRYLGHVDDATLRATLATARAMVFASEIEGFGLPPVEALHAGLPVIVAANLPSVAMLPPGGQIRLVRADAASIADAVRSMQDDATAARMWQEAALLPNRRWQDFAADVAGWMESMPLPV